MLRPIFWCLLAGLTAWLLSASWMRWMDPFIDFGRELYVPWRILNGEPLGTHFVHLYGPLSAYLNAGVFYVFGPSIRVLVIANLAVFSGIIVCLFVISRRAFGLLPAAMTTLVAVAVFGFGHYYGVNNYTYAAPYSHEATHGMLFLLLLLIWLGTYRSQSGQRWGGFVAGFLIGLGWLTKTEYVFVTSILWAASIIRIWLSELLRPRLAAWLGQTAGGFAGVFLVAWVALAVATTPVAAAKSVANSVLAPVLYGNLSSSTLGLRLMGVDNLGGNLRTIAIWGGFALGVILLLTVVGRAIDPRSNRWWPRAYLALVLVGAGVATFRVPWLFCGTAFPVLLAAGVFYLVWRQFDTGRGWRNLSGRRWTQTLYLLAALGMLVRMAFDPTISHYGFVQAMLAGTWLCGFLLGEWPRMAAGTRVVRAGLVWGVLIFLGGGTILLVQRSLQFYRVKDTPIGEAGDRILGYNPRVYALPELWEQARQHLVTTSRASETMLVIPEGISLNYWTRRKHPLRITDVLPATTRLNPGDLLTELAAAPPDIVVLTTRNLQEFGHGYYGENESAGKSVVDWVEKNYAPVATSGEFPLAAGKMGVWICRRK